MGQRARVTIDWLRKGRQIDDIRILRNLIADSTEWNLDTERIDEKLFETIFNLQPLPEISQSIDAINNVLGQQEVTEKIRINKRPIIPSGTNIRKQVSSLLPSNLNKSEKENLSYVLTRFVLDDTPQEIKWPIVPVGLDNLSAALFTIQMISRFSGNEISWLFPVWYIKTNETKLQTIQMILQALDSNSDIDLEDVMRRSKESIEKMLVEDAYSGQDPLSDKIDRWRQSLPVVLSNLEETRKELNRARKKLEAALKRADSDIRSVLKIKHNIDREKAMDKLENTEQKKVKDLLELQKKHSDYESRFRDLQNTTRNIINGIKKEEALLRENIQSTTHWNVQTLHPDGPAAFEHELLLDKIRGHMNILNYGPLVQMCKYLAQIEMPGKPVASEIEQQLGLKRRVSHYMLQRLRFVMDEHYFPSVPKLGLRYRFIFSEKQKPEVSSKGLVEKLILTDSDYRGCTVHIEPVESQGPKSSSLPTKHHQALVNSEIVSMRMDLYDSKNKKWVLEPWKSAVRGKTSNWLYRETEYSSIDTDSLTPRQLDIIGPLCVFRGLRPARNWLFQQLGYPIITARRYVKNLLDKQILRLLYLPALEYCGLPLGMLVVSEFKNSKTLRLFIDWMTSRLPFARILTDNSTNLVAYTRLPTGSLGVVQGVIREKLVGAKSNFWFTSRIMSFRTYQMTVFQRLSRMTDDRWLDPWI